MDFFRKLFGLPEYDKFSSFPRTDDLEPNDETFLNSSQPPNHSSNFPRRGFDIFTDPFQMQQYFEQEMNEMMKIFGFQGLRDFSFDHPNIPSLEDSTAKFQDTPNGSLRDQFLKNGYESPAKRKTDRVDQDLDAKVEFGNLNSIMSEGYDKQNLYTHEEPQSRGFFYGTSHTMKTVTNPDGSIETHHTTRDNQGNEETTICHKIGEKEYCIMKKRDKSGKEEVTEQFLNMDESEKKIFLKPSPGIDNGNEPRFPFNKFFE